MIIHIPMQLGKKNCFGICKVTSITKKFNNQNKNKAKPRLCRRYFLKERKQVFHKKTKFKKTNLHKSINLKNSLNKN
jgi:hypothetical protein